MHSASHCQHHKAIRRFQAELGQSKTKLFSMIRFEIDFQIMAIRTKGANPLPPNFSATIPMSFKKKRCTYLHYQLYININNQLQKFKCQGVSAKKVIVSESPPNINIF